MALNLNDKTETRKVGSLGDIVFEVSAGYNLTFQSYKYSASGKYAQHELIGRKNIVEALGTKSAEASFEITLSEYLGVSVSDALDALKTLMTNGMAVSLVIGNEPQGDYLWVLESYTVTGEYYAGNGRLISAKVNLQLLEYPRRGESML